jgi:hypothetical protein
MDRKAEYREWGIDAARYSLPNMIGAAAVIESSPTEDDLGQRFVFNDLGDFATREQAEARSTAWVKRWIDENYGHR